MKFRIYSKLKNMILSIIFAILIFFKLVMFNFMKNIRVGRYENFFFFFFLEGHKNFRVSTKKQQQKKKQGRSG